MRAFYSSAHSAPRLGLRLCLNATTMRCVARIYPLHWYVNGPVMDEGWNTQVSGVVMLGGGTSSRVSRDLHELPHSFCVCLLSLASEGCEARRHEICPEY